MEGVDQSVEVEVTAQSPRTRTRLEKHVGRLGSFRNQQRSRERAEQRVWTEDNDMFGVDDSVVYGALGEDLEGVFQEAEQKRQIRQREKQLLWPWRCARYILCGSLRPVEWILGKRFYRSTEELYRERAELLSVRNIMVDGRPQAVASMLYNFNEILDPEFTSELLKGEGKEQQEVLQSLFLREWLSSKIQRAKQAIPFVFDREHQIHNYIHMSPFRVNEETHLLHV
eukprot:COSAG01_NODE_23283_length_821_cov_0.768698_1_plen_226_part_10